jgi:septum formation protein
VSAKVPLSRILLASASPRRLELLRSLGCDVDVQASGYEEPELPGLRPAETALHHAREKLAAVLAACRPEIPVVAADTVVELGGVSLGKPADAAEAAGMLRRLSGRDHFVHTAFALWLPGRDPLAELSTARVRFYPLDEDEIAAYVATAEPYDKAGGYGIQGRAAALVESVEGDFYTVVGFPVARFIRALARSGFSLPAAKSRL